MRSERREEKRRDEKRGEKMSFYFLKKLIKVFKLDN
jgi:hypothetical protein